jgi:hypothetical protein
MRSRAPIPAQLFLAASLLACAPEAREQHLVLLGEPGPWPWVSELIGYGERLWFANSVHNVQHNSADLYSYDPRTGSIRFERHLFSQGVGRPTVANGLLYWPHEDSRFHLGVGQVSVTDGVAWGLLVLPSTQINHIHAAAELRGRLYVSASSRRPLVFASADEGLTWKLVHAAPERHRRVVRILRLAALDAKLYGHLLDAIVHKVESTLVRIQEARLSPVPGWPDDAEILALAPFRGRLYAVVTEESGRAIWSTDGERTRREGDGPPGVRVRDLVSEEGRQLWALSVGQDGGAIWRSRDARTWKLHARLPQGRPQELHLYAGQPYVGGQGAGGRGALWGPAPPATAAPRPSAPRLPVRQARAGVDWSAAGAGLDASLADPASYGSGAAALTELLLRLSLAGPPGDFLSPRLSSAFPAGGVAMLQNQDPVPMEQLGRWLLLWAIAVSKSGSVPPSWLREPWTAPPSEFEKYFEPLLGALAAIAWTGQGDVETLQALIDRLEAPNDPPWLTGDVVGALSAITGERFGYDAAAWRSWWERARVAWREGALTVEPVGPAPGAHQGGERGDGEHARVPEVDRAGSSGP